MHCDPRHQCAVLQVSAGATSGYLSCVDNDIISDCNSENGSIGRARYHLLAEDSSVCTH